MKSAINLPNLNPLLLMAAVFFAALTLLVTPLAIQAHDIPMELEQFLSDSLAETPDQIDIITSKLAQAADAGVTPDALKGIIYQSFERGLVTMEIEKIFDVIIEVGENNICTEPLTNKVLEGLAKNVDMEHLLFALDRTAERLVSADNILKDFDYVGLSSDERDDLLSDIVAAMATGVRNEELRSVLTDMGESGKKDGELNPKDIVDLLQALVGYGIDSDTAGSLTSRVITSEDLDRDDLHEIREAVYEEHREKSSKKRLIATVEGYFNGGEDDTSDGYGDEKEENDSNSNSGEDSDDGDDDGDDGSDDGGEEE